jgi:hypothetical protein
MRRDRNLELGDIFFVERQARLDHPSAGHDSAYTVEKSCLNLSQPFYDHGLRCADVLLLFSTLIVEGEISYRDELFATK